MKTLKSATEQRRNSVVNSSSSRMGDNLNKPEGPSQTLYARYQKVAKSSKGNGQLLLILFTEQGDPQPYLHRFGLALSQIGLYSDQKVKNVTIHTPLMCQRLGEPHGRTEILTIQSLPISQRSLKRLVSSYRLDKQITHWGFGSLRAFQRRISVTSTKKSQIGANRRCYNQTSTFGKVRNPGDHSTIGTASCRFIMLLAENLGRE